MYVSTRVTVRCDNRGKNKKTEKSVQKNLYKMSHLARSTFDPSMPCHTARHCRVDNVNRLFDIILSADVSEVPTRDRQGRPTVQWLIRHCLTFDPLTLNECIGCYVLTDNDRPCGAASTCYNARHSTIQGLGSAS